VLATSPGSVALLVGPPGAVDGVGAEQAARSARLSAAVGALNVADTRTAQVLRGAVTELTALRRAATELQWYVGPSTVRVGQGAEDDGLDGPVDPGGGGLWTNAKRFLSRTIDGAASMGNAALHHPVAAAELIAGTALMDLGVTGEVGGLALDATGVGTVAGAPVAVASAVPLAAGAGLAALGGSTIWLNATGEDKVTPTGGPGGEVARIDIENANFAQRSASRRFSGRGDFRGKTIDDVAAELRSGKLTPEDVPIDAINREGHSLILNTRSSLALEEAGVPRSEWKVTNRTGQFDYERRLADQLRRNGLDASGIVSVRS
jgi:hypothetical protein